MVRKIIIFLGLVVFMTNCSSRKPLMQIESKEGQAIVSGKIYVYYNGVDVSENVSVRFNELGPGRFTYRTDSSHILLTHFPMGECYIAKLAYQGFKINIPKEQSLVTISSSDSIYYLGDITFAWKGANHKVPGAVLFGLLGALIYKIPGAVLFGLVGVILDDANPDGKVDIYVESNPASMAVSISNKYGTQKPLKTNIMPAALLTADIKENITKNIIKTYIYQFNLNDGQSIQGKLFKKTDDELYIIDKKVVYIVKRVKLLSITRDSQDITEEALNDFEKLDISLFKYSVRRIE